MLAELCRKPFKSDQWLGWLGPKPSSQIVERGLASLIPRLSHPSQDLERQQVGTLGQDPNLFAGSTLFVPGQRSEKEEADR
jgi:hypothetical protein